MIEQDLTTREKIINVARRLAMSDGLFNLTVEDIIRAAEISEEIFHKFFKDEREIVWDLFTTRFGLADKNVLILPIKEKIRLFNSEFMKQIETARVEICRQWITENLKSGETISRDKELARKILNSSIQSGELKPDTPEEELADFIVTTLYGMMLHWCMTDKKFEPLEHVDTFSGFIINSLKPYMN